MQLNQLTREPQSQRSAQLQTTLIGRYPKTLNKKLFTQQSSSTTSPLQTTLTKRAHQLLNRNPASAAKSETFINMQSISRSLASRQPTSVFSNTFISKDGHDINFSSLKDTASDMVAKRSVQVLIGRNQNKQQYSKFNRRKEDIAKKNTISDPSQKVENPIHKMEEFSQQKLIQKYRQLIFKKESNNKPFNMVNKLYQIQLLTTKEASLNPKDSIKAVPFKLQDAKKSREIESKIERLVMRPPQLHKVKHMLTYHSQKDVLEEPCSSAKIQKNNRQIKPKPAPSIKRQSQNETIEKTQIEKKQPKIAQIRAKGHLSQKIQCSNADSDSPQKTESKGNYPLPKKVSSTAYIIYEMPKPEQLRGGSKKLQRLQGSPLRKRALSGKIHASVNMKAPSQIASLTKIMTCLIVIELMERLQIDSRSQKYKIGVFESGIRGTSAQIQQGDIYTIHELLLGLMLPSGNDASLALARWAGNVMILHDADHHDKKKPTVDIQSEPQPWAIHNKCIRHKEQKIKPKRCYNRFLAEMNKKARLLNLQRTTYVNSHGLSNPHNKSCCLDLARLCEYAIQNPYFREIVSCKAYQNTIDKEVVVGSKQTIKQKKRPSKSSLNREDPEQMNLEEDAEGDYMQNRSQSGQDSQEEEIESVEDEQGPWNVTNADESKKAKLQSKVRKTELTKRQIQWTNTHKLLHNKPEKYIGIKTGVTVTAGACLASCLRLEDKKFIIVVLNAKKLSQRFVDTEILRKWVQKKQQLGQREPESQLDTYS